MLGIAISGRRAATVAVRGGGGWAGGMGLKVPRASYNVSLALAHFYFCGFRAVLKRRMHFKYGAARAV
jgi:hypothetical protein